MWTYTYKHGDRPLDGYTIQRAAGRGGFGEVYYAVSDAGREVALKAITGFEQIELRGIGQCMNLKSPHLVTIFDVKQNAEGRWFVLMEYVSGLNLRELLDQSPAGLGTQKAAFFLREIAKGLSYLHDCGIVHRDLKPANIFFENGYVKIGDYGLSKAIQPTHHSGQTVTVGTVHYMAPEVGVGKYDRSIDIYALGALLYELLTGMVPFVGASPSEILIKHLSADADCTGIPEPFCSAIKKAMAKDPAQRFATVQELVEAVFGAEHVRNSVSQFSPTDLSVVAGRIAERLAAAPPAAPARAGQTAGIGATPPPPSSVTNPNGLGSPPPLPRGSSDDPGGAWAAGWVAGQAVRGGRRLGAAVLGPNPGPLTAPMGATPDTLGGGRRILLGLLAAFVVSCAAVLFSGARAEEEIWLQTLFAIAGTAAAIYLSARYWLPRPIAGTGWADRFALAAAGALGGIAASAPIWIDSFEARGHQKGMFITLLMALAVGHPRRWTNPDRLNRINFGTAVGAGFLAFIASVIFGGNGVLAIAIVGGTALVVQVLAPWDEPAAARRKAAGETDDDDDDDDDDEDDEDERAAADAQPAVAGAGGGAHAYGGAAAAAGGASPVRAMPPSYAPVWTGERLVPRGLLIGWFFGTLGFLTIGLLLSVVGGVSNMPPNDFAAITAWSLVMYAFAVFCFRRMRRRTFQSWITYLVLPAVRLVCMIVVLSCWALWGLGRYGRSDEEGFAVAIVLFGMFWALTWTGPWLWRKAIPPVLPPLPAPPTPATRYEHTAAAVGAAVGEARAAVETAVHAARDAVRDTVNAVRDAHAPAAAAATPAPVKPARRHRRRRQGRGLIGGAAALLSGILLLAGFVIATLLAFDLPAMLSVGVPDPSLANEIRNGMFNGRVEDWSGLLRSLMSVSSGVLLLVALAALIVARRREGGVHILRGVVGVLGAVVALGPFQSEIAHRRPWERLLNVPEANRAGWPAVQVLLDCLRMPGAFMTIVLLLLALIVLAWPARPPRERLPLEEVAV